MILRLLLLLSFMWSLSAKAQRVDTIYTATLKEVNVNATRKWANDTTWYRYNQLKYYVKTVMPYVLEATKSFNAIVSESAQVGVGRKDRRRIVERYEDELRVRFEDKIRSLNETQGILIIKLVARQTGVNIHSILQDFKNPVTALKWQTWARLHGFNLNRKYDPADEPLLEMVMISLGYPLPAGESLTAQ